MNTFLRVTFCARVCWKWSRALGSTFLRVTFWAWTCTFLPHGDLGGPMGNYTDLYGNGPMWTYTDPCGPIRTHSDLWGRMETYGDRPMGTYADLGGPMGTCGDLWGHIPMGTYGTAPAPCSQWPLS